jgi:hypothetical protein
LWRDPLPLTGEGGAEGARGGPELKETTRKTNAFADDSHAGLYRSADNLARVKNILMDFGDISGLETNVEKTTLMPIGGLDAGISQEIRVSQL